MKNSEKYLVDRGEIIDAIANSEPGTFLTSHRFNLVSANLFKFLPRLSFEQHKEVFTEILLHNQLSHFEQAQIETLEATTTENVTPELLNLLKGRPCILSGFHFGSYRLMNLFLTKNKIPYTIIIPKASLKNEGDVINKIYSQLHDGNPEQHIRFIEMESPALGLKMLRELKSGRSLFIYFDGYRGLGEIRDNNRYEETINFLGQPLLARKGVAYIAQAAGVPLITAISYRKSLEDIRLYFFDPIFSDPAISKEQFAHNSTQLVYDRFTPFLHSYPGQWEGWLYLHKSIVHTLHKPKEVDAVSSPLIIGSTTKFSLNHHEYGVFQVESNSYLFEKKSYTTYPIDPVTYDLLKISAQHCIENNQVARQVFRLLTESRILIPVAA